MRYAMIMAGGAGTRLWPMSRQARPKQLLPFIGGRSLLELAAGRLVGLIPSERRLICTGEPFRNAIRSSMPSFSDAQILGEPVGRDTVNAVGFTAAVLAKSDPDAIFAVLTADHLIEPLNEFQRKLDLGFRLVEDDPNRLITFGITPTRPETGYGYVEPDGPISGFEPARKVKRFTEKPDAGNAKRIIDAGGAWNSGMFIFHAATVLDALSRFKPEAHEGLMKIQHAWGTPDQPRVLKEVYPVLPKVSVDYAIMEPATRATRHGEKSTSQQVDKSTELGRPNSELSVCMVPLDLTWMDVGSWTSYGQTLAADEHGNRSNASLIHLDSRNVLAVSDDAGHTIATIGCEDLIIVRTPDATLVCRADQAQRVKDIAAMVDESLR